MGLFVVRNERKNSIKYLSHSVKLNPIRPSAVYGIISVTIYLAKLKSTFRFH